MFDYYHKWQRQVGFKEYQPLEQGNNMTPTKLPEEGNRSIKLQKPASTEEDQTGPSTEEDLRRITHHPVGLLIKMIYAQRTC